MSANEVMFCNHDSRLVVLPIGIRALLMLVLVSTGAVAQTTVEKPQTIRVVMDNAYAPYSFQSDEGKLQGILIDQWRAWERKTGIKVEIDAMDWGEALRRMRAGEFDVIDSIVETAERRDYFDFTPAYTPIEASIYFDSDISGIVDLASLKGFTVGAKTGDQHIDRLKANGVTAVILFQNDEAIVEAAKQHKINVFLADDPSALYLLNKMGIEAEFRHSAPIFRDELRRAVRKGDAATLRIVLDGFAAIEPRELKQINEKWFGRTIRSYGRYLIYAGYATAAAMLLIAGLATWNRALRKRVRQRTAALGESEQRFRQIAENISEVFWLSSPEPTLIHYISPGYEKIWGRSCESLYTEARSWLDSVHPDDRGRVAQAERLQSVSGQHDYTYRIIRPDGSLRWIRDRAFPVRDKSGKLIRVAGIAEDITERRSAEEELKKEKEILAKVFDNIPVLIGFVGADGVELVNPEWERTMGWTLKELQEQKVDIFAEAYPDPSYRQKILDFVAASTGEWTDLKIKVRDGRVIDAACAVVHLSDGTKIAIAQDISERKHAEEKLERSTQLLQLLSRRLFQTQEDERRHLARELHDEIGQALTAAKINTDMLRAAVPPDLLARLNENAAILDRLLQQTRQISLDLRPPLLDDLGLVPALRWYVNQQAERAGLETKFFADPLGDDVPPHIQIVCFRLAQETITNVVRHAHAKTLRVELRRAAGSLLLVVHDDGVGFDVIKAEALAQEGASLGLLSMKERAALAGGSLQVISSPGEGATVEVLLPLAIGEGALVTQARGKAKSGEE
jgi:PAS domain S-box-containing protein